MLDKKAVLIKLTIKTICSTKKLFWIVIKITFLIINSNNQELFHHIHCKEVRYWLTTVFWYNACNHHTRTCQHRCHFFDWFKNSVHQFCLWLFNYCIFFINGKGQLKINKYVKIIRKSSNYNFKLAEAFIYSDHYQYRMWIQNQLSGLSNK